MSLDNIEEVPSDEPDYVFQDEPNYRRGRQQEVPIPIHRGKDKMDRTRMNYSTSIRGIEAESQADHTHNTPGRATAATIPGAAHRGTTSARVRGTAVGRTGSVISEPGLHRLSTPIIPRPKHVPNRRIADVNISPSLDGIVEDIPERIRDSTIGDNPDQDMRLMKSRQIRMEEKLERFQEGLDTIMTTVQGADSMYRLLQENIEDLKSNCDEVWQRLMSDEKRFIKLESSIEKLNVKIDDNMEIVQEWFVDISARATSDVPAEIVNSIQEVIKDSAPGAAVERMREDLEEMRDFMSS